MPRKRWTINITANIGVTVENDGEEPTAEEVEEAVGKYVEVRNGVHFDSDEFEIMSSEDIPDGE